MSRRARATAILALLAAALMPAAARADSVVVSTQPQQFVPPEAVLDAGGALTLVNADPIAHNLVSTQKGPDGQPLFASSTIGPGATAVEGTENLEPGTYPFVCTLHAGMDGNLNVLDVSVPAPELPGLPGLPEPPATDAAPLPVASVPTPSSLTVHDGSLYVASYGGGSVFELAIGEAGTLGVPQQYADGFSSPLGVEFAPDGTMFVADSHPSSREGRSTDGRVWAVAPDGSRSVVVDELPNGRHNTNGMAVKDGRLYIANGNSTDDGINGGEPEEPLSGTLISVPLEARDLTPQSPELVVEAHGMRNLYDVAFRPGTTEAWIPTNGPDTFDPYGEDLLHMADITGEAPDFGFPGCLYAAPPNEPRFIQNPTEGVAPCDPDHTPPEQLLGLHVSANGLAFGFDDAFWGGSDEVGDLFIAEFGNFFGDEVVGHQVVRVPMDADGNSGPPETFLPQVAPLDLTFGPPGTGMYIGDFATGQIQLVRGL